MLAGNSPPVPFVNSSLDQGDTSRISAVEVQLSKFVAEEDHQKDILKVFGEGLKKLGQGLVDAEVQ